MGLLVYFQAVGGSFWDGGKGKQSQIFSYKPEGREFESLRLLSRRALTTTSQHLAPFRPLK
jgi:hypothetical protein